MAILNKSEILNVDDSESVLVEVPEWGGEVRICAMNIEERLDFEQENCNEDGTWKNIKNPTLYYSLIANSVKTEDGELVFDKDEISLLKTKNAKVIQNLFNVALTVNYKTKEATAELKKNFQAITSGSLPTG